MIRPDLCASTGQGLLRAYQLTGKTRWLETARHWGDLPPSTATSIQADPWPRWPIRNSAGKTTRPRVDDDSEFSRRSDPLGFRGQDNRIVAARDAGHAMRDRLLPVQNDTWGRYWIKQPVQNSPPLPMPRVTCRSPGPFRIKP
jgi:hypothetical protein